MLQHSICIILDRGGSISIDEFHDGNAPGFLISVNAEDSVFITVEEFTEFLADIEKVMGYPHGRI